MTSDSGSMPSATPASSAAGVICRAAAISASSAEEAIAQVRKLGRRPDIVIADYRLQDGRTGTEAIFAIRALFNHPIPGLILTGETDLKFLRECTGHDVGIAHKPVMPAQLGRALDEQLNAAA